MTNAVVPLVSPKKVGDPLHTLLHCPHSSPLSLPAIHSLTHALRRYDLCLWSSHTQLQQPFSSAVLPSAPSQIRQSMDPLYLAYVYTIYSVQPHFLKHQPSASLAPQPLPGPYHPSLTPIAVSFRRIPNAKYVESPSDQDKMLLCDICNAGWHMDCLLPLLTTIQAGVWKCPSCTPSAPLSQVALDTSASPPLSLTLTMIKHCRLNRETQKKTTLLMTTSYHNSPSKQLPKTNKTLLPLLASRPATCTTPPAPLIWSISSRPESGVQRLKMKSSTWFAMEGLGQYISSCKETL